MSEKFPHGIVCDVKNCVFNHEGSRCTAKTIEVRSTCSEPECCDETLCRTFRPSTEEQ
ncbi:MAG: DUF1540 domain-containing protein [Ruminococcus sp.]|nr:DUF1540 domain-containing protein [Ruminococcus sp.]